MNFAFPALLIFLLALPGLILRYTYSRGFFRDKSPVSFRPITDEIGYSVVIAASLHLVACVVVTNIGFSINLRAAWILLTGSYGKDNQDFDAAIGAFTEFPLEVCFYFLALFAFSALLGYSIHFLIRKCHLDLKYQSLRFRNEWFYLLTGEILQYDEEEEDRRAVDGTYLSGIVHQGDKCYLYRGIVQDFYFDYQGNLDRVVLVAAQRREIGADRTTQERTERPDEDPRYYNIEGKYFIIRYSEIKTMNINYFRLEPLNAPSASSGPQAFDPEG